MKIIRINNYCNTNHNDNGKINNNNVTNKYNNKMIMSIMNNDIY